MKKLMILGLMISLFTFGGNDEVKKTHAQESETSATFFSGSLAYSSALSSYASNIVSIKVSNIASDLPSGNYKKVVIEGCTYTDVNGVTTTPAEGIIFAYLSYASDSTIDNVRYDCVLYANAEKIYSNPDASFMFDQFLALEKVDIKLLDTSKTINMCGFFAHCIKLKYVDVSNMDTSNVTDISDMFSFCQQLTELDLSVFNTSKVEYFGRMFNYCDSLKKIDLSSFDMSLNCDFLDRVFSNDNNLEYLKCPKILPADSTTNSNHAITLPTKLADYYGVTTLTCDNLAQYKELCIPGDEFIKNWRTLRTDGGDNGICAALTNGTESNTNLTKLLTEYDAFDDDYKEYVNKANDENEVTIGESISYIKSYINSKQAETNINESKEDAGSFMTMSITEESPYLIAVISLIGILSVVGYYFYNKKKQAM